jgi:hypothetical protein
MNRKTLVFLLIASALAITNSEAADPTLYDYTFKEAILKIDVKFQHSKLDPSDGKEICVSEGTGFAVDSTHVITAKHVVDRDPDCGPPGIIAKSFADDSQIVMKLVDSIGDVALLAATNPFTSSYASAVDSIQGSPCSVIVSLFDNSFNQSAIRFGIPGGTIEPQLVPVQVGSQFGQFNQLISITPIEVNGGESGGPIFRDAEVVGMIEAKVRDPNMIGLMLKASEILPLLTRNNISQQASADRCHPSFYQRRVKQTLLNNVRAQVGQVQIGRVEGKVTINKSTEDKYLQTLLTETARKAVEESLNRIIPNDGVQVATRIQLDGSVSFQVVATGAGAIGDPFLPNINVLGRIEQVLPNILELDTKAQLNSVFEQQIALNPQYSHTSNNGPHFNELIQLDRSTQIQAPVELLPNEVVPNWQERLLRLEPSEKVHLNQELQRLSPRG